MKEQTLLDKALALKVKGRIRPLYDPQQLDVIWACALGQISSAHCADVLGINRTNLPSHCASVFSEAIRRGDVIRKAGAQ